MCQGFGVVIGSAPKTISFKETEKLTTVAALTSNGSMLRPIKPFDDVNSVTLTLKEDANDFLCPTTISFRNDYTKKFDFSEDSYYIMTPEETAPVLYSLSEDDQKLIINKLPDADMVIDVPINAVAQISANYTLSINGLDNLTSYNCVNLVDKSTGRILANFEDTPDYTFSVLNPNEVKNYILRFSRLNPGENCDNPDNVSSINLLPGEVSIIPNEIGVNVKFNLSQPSNATISVINLLGEKITDDVTTNAYDNTISIPLSSGQMYIIKVQTTNGLVIKKLYH